MSQNEISNVQVRCFDRSLQHLWQHKNRGTIIRLQPAYMVRTTLGEDDNYHEEVRPFAFVSFVEGRAGPEEDSMPQISCGLSDEDHGKFMSRYHTGTKKGQWKMLSKAASEAFPFDPASAEPIVEGKSADWTRVQKGSHRPTCTMIDTSGTSVPYGCMYETEVGIGAARHGITARGEFGRWSMSQEDQQRTGIMSFTIQPTLLSTAGDVKHGLGAILTVRSPAPDEEDEEDTDLDYTVECEEFVGAMKSLIEGWIDQETTVSPTSPLGTHNRRSIADQRIFTKTCLRQLTDSLTEHITEGSESTRYELTGHLVGRDESILE